MGTITIVGLGPGDPRCLTREAWQVLESAAEVWLRTERHPTVTGLPPGLTLHTFDYLYEEAGDSQQVYEAIVGEVLRLGQRPEGIVYAVPGHPLVGESTVQQVLLRAGKSGQSVRIVEGLSFVAPALTALRVDALSGLQICDAIELAARYYPPLNPDLPALVGQLYGRQLAADVKLTLMNQYPDDHEVALVRATGTPEQRVARLPLYELDRRDNAHPTALYVPPLPGVTSFEGLQDTVAHLRAPEGCPWDREQTHESLRAGLLEETYEVVAAIDAGDTPALQEELGDLLLQILLQTQIATEAGEFKMARVIAGIDAKLKHRHPHVWGERQVSGTGEVLQCWEELKREEKGAERSALDGVPAALPALQQANTYSQRAARVGFDWNAASGVADKVREEITEVEAATTLQEREAELGDLLFAVVNWARWLDADPETALRKASARFARRFRGVERMARQRGLDIAALTIDELEALWQEAKKPGLRQPHVAQKPGF
ncbi:MAG: nucleoside triphosphate pyrophosphohydrolase [Anaerolineaceae bacterium 4572_32.2]|nr:MAG: nucleoside triphosphate pyrophosphohydrolase [Anaerolineaceae bacterium 4572_32.2]